MRLVHVDLVCQLPGILHVRSTGFDRKGAQIGW